MLCMMSVKMIRLLTWLFMGHCHKWEEVAVNRLVLTGRGGEAVANGEEYILRCKHCGNMKKYETV